MVRGVGVEAVGVWVEGSGWDQGGRRGWGQGLGLGELRSEGLGLRKLGSGEFGSGGTGGRKSREQGG